MNAERDRQNEIPTDIWEFWRRHPELILLGITDRPMAWPIYNFMAADGVRVNVSVDYGGYGHISFSKRQPPFFRPNTRAAASDEEMGRYLDFFYGKRYVRRPSPMGTGVVHFYAVGHPEARGG